jgi:hypothetical protein
MTVTSPIFWDVTPCSPLKINRSLGVDKPPDFTLVSCSAYFSTLKMEAIFYSETSVDTQLTTRRYIPEDSTLHNHRCENPKSYIRDCVLNTPPRPSTLRQIHQADINEKFYCSFRILLILCPFLGPRLTNILFSSGFTNFLCIFHYFLVCFTPFTSPLDSVTLILFDE